MQGQLSSQADAQHEADHASLGSLARWRNKDRIKTQAAALILCLNIGVDPPDVVKVSPCARMECWMQPDPGQSTKNSQGIAKALQQQYERWQPRARYKTQADPTVDDVKKLCREARRAARVRLHSAVPAVVVTLTRSASDCLFAHAERESIVSLQRPWSPSADSERGDMGLQQELYSVHSRLHP